MIIIKNTWIEDRVKFKEEMIKWILQLNTHITSIFLL